MQKYIHEIFEEFKAAPSMEDKKNVLRKYHNNLGLVIVLRGTYHPNIKYAVHSVPNYKPNNTPIGYSTTTIAFEAKRLYLFEENHPRVAPGFTEEQRQRILIQILEALDKNDAVIFMNMLLKDQRVPDLNKELIEEALPGIFRDE